MPVPVKTRSASLLKKFVDLALESGLHAGKAGLRAVVVRLVPKKRVTLDCGLLSPRVMEEL